MGNVQYMVGHGDADDGGNEDIVIEKNKTGADRAEQRPARQAEQKRARGPDLQRRDQRPEGAGQQRLRTARQGRPEGEVDGTQSLTVGGDREGEDRRRRELGRRRRPKEKIGGAMSLQIGSKQESRSARPTPWKPARRYTSRPARRSSSRRACSVALKVGGNFVDIGPSGVAIKGTMVMINSGGAAGSGTAPSPSPPDAPGRAGRRGQGQGRRASQADQAGHGRQRLDRAEVAARVRTSVSSARIGMRTEDPCLRPPVSATCTFARWSPAWCPHVGGPILPPGCPTVLIGMMPAARVGDMATCVGPPDVIAKGSPRC